MVHIKKLVILALFLAGASVLHIIETWIPVPFPVPGVKLGLANIVSIAALGMFGWREALYIGILRVCMGALFTGTLFGPTFLMSLSGTLCSIGVMSYLYQRVYPGFSFIGISVAGAVVHNMAQIVVVALVASSTGLLWYVPYLILFAIPTGVATGFTAIYFFQKAPKMA